MLSIPVSEHMNLPAKAIAPYMPKKFPKIQGRHYMSHSSHIHDLLEAFFLLTQDQENF